MSVKPACIQASVAAHVGNVLGESVIWSARASRIYWVDAMRPALYWLDETSGKCACIELPLHEPVGMIAQTTDPNRLALTYAGGVGLLDLIKGTIDTFANPEQARAGIGFSDGKVDFRGNLWVGTYDLAERAPRGNLWMISPDGRPVLAESGLIVVNGPAFSPDGGLLYLSDSNGRRILAYELQAEKPHLRSQRVFADMTEIEGMPDGLTVDSDGCVWCAQYGGGRVTRFAVDGTRLMTVEVPVSSVTSVAFGGARLDKLYISTAKYGLTQEHLASMPDAGDMFVATPGITGLDAPLFKVP